MPLPSYSHIVFMGQGSNLGWEIPGLQSCVLVIGIPFVWKWFVWPARRDQRNGSGAEPVTLVNFHSPALWLCLFLLDAILNKHEGTSQATDEGF